MCHSPPYVRLITLRLQSLPKHKEFLERDRGAGGNVARRRICCGLFTWLSSVSIQNRYKHFRCGLSAFTVKGCVHPLTEYQARCSCVASLQKLESINPSLSRTKEIMTSFINLDRISTHRRTKEEKYMKQGSE